MGMPAGLGSKPERQRPSRRRESHSSRRLPSYRWGIEDRGYTMLIAVDVGNTQTTIGVYDGESMRAFWRVPSDRKATSDQVLIQLHSLLGLQPGLLGNIDGGVVSSVVPPLTISWKSAVSTLLSDGGSEEPRLEIVDATRDYGVKLRFANPREVGPDRIADAVGATAKYGYPCIVVDLGTATNIEVIDGDGALIGGIIAPGIAVSANAMFSHAARLAQVDLAIPEHVIGRGTVEAIQSGLTYGEVSRIDGLVRLIRGEMGCDDARVIATGGLISLIAPISETIDICDSFLTLDGLRIIFERTRG